ncbi:MAG: C40 family peptidase [Bacteroidetes bacterium]|nr:C40 family peptidase [Bacteroidota bacterium]
MDFGICLQSVIPVRAEPSHKSEMVTQVLFGELYRIIGKENEWLKVRLVYDNYEGWIGAKQSVQLDEEEFIRLINADSPASLDLVQLLSSDTRRTIIPILLGSSLPGFADQKFTIAGETFSFDGLIADTTLLETSQTPQERQKAKQTIVDDAMLYLHAPYLWGGRTPFGIDCSGLTQMVYKLKKIKLLRDAAQQATHGEPLNFISEAEPGDLAFFDNEEGNIVHVGLMLDKSRIIHASGKVRIDMIDHEGIFNEEEQQYTHKLRVIKRII